MVRSEVYLNKYLVSIAPFSTPPIQKTSLFACFRVLVFHPFFQGGQLTPFAPTCGRPCVRGCFAAGKDKGENGNHSSPSIPRSATSHCTIAHAGNVARNRRLETRHELDPGGTDLTVQQMLKLTHQGAASGMMSGTTVRALILCRFSQKNRIER